ncbi:MAG TPA: threonine/serine exporter family protein [Treponemataceae bacterium]|nr:threonine/serine exporter family protein [Treponemataceae bacterium]
MPDTTRTDTDTHSAQTDGIRTNEDRILDIALDSGLIILQSGGETYRAEETMGTVACSLGAAHASAFVTPTVVMLTCVDSRNQSRTRIERVQDRSINLGRIARVNELSHRLVDHRDRPADLRKAETVLRRIRNEPLHGKAGVIFATALSCYCFSFMFNGSPAEAACAFVIGACLRVLLFALNSLRLSSFIVTIIGGLMVSLASGLAALSALVPGAGNVSISVLMTLVPGLAIVNAIRDIISGDLVAGSARLLEAFVIASALSLGAAGGLLLIPSLPGVSDLTYLTAPPASFALAFLATAAFAWFYHITRYDILWAALFGAAGWIVYLFVSHELGNQFAGYLTGALIVGLCAEFTAVVARKPATVYIVPGIIPFVPGGGMYQTMFEVVLGHGDAAAQKAFSTLTAAASIAVGIAIASSLARLVSRFRQRKL